MSQHCIEIARFRLRDGVDEAQLLAQEHKIRSGHIRQQPGYLGRELGKDAVTGEWLMVMRFEDRSQMDAWMAGIKSIPQMQELAALIDPASVEMRIFTHAA